MMVFPTMIVPAAEQAGMKVPPDPDNFDPNEYPHFQVFCTIQLGRAMSSPGQHWDNAKVIAAIPDDRIRVTTLTDLQAAGCDLS